ncbi:unnamed protein product [Cunninghamella blakesleeana]
MNEMMMMDNNEESDDGDHMTDTTTIPYLSKYYHFGGTDIYTWGMNATYILGHLDSENRTRPERVPLNLESQTSCHFLRRSSYLIKSVHMAKFHMAIITSESSHNLLLCGFGRGGRLGNGSGGSGKDRNDVQLAPTPIDWPEKFLSVALGRDHTIALTTNGNVITFGSNEYGQLGYDLEDRSDNLNQFTPRKIQSQNLKRQPFIGVAASKVHSIVYTSHELFSFGYNQGQLGYHHLGNEVRQVLPRKVTFAFKILQVVANDYATVILNQNHDVMVLANYETNKVIFPLNRFPNNIAVHSFATNRIIKIISSGDIYLGAISSMGDVYIWTCKPITPITDADKQQQQQQRLKNNSGVIVSSPKKVWVASRSDMAATDASIGQDGEIIICTISGNVFVGGTIKNYSKDGKFKFYRINNLQRCIQVCANPNGSFAAIRSEYLLNLPKSLESTFKADLLSSLPHIATLHSLEKENIEMEMKKNYSLELIKNKYITINKLDDLIQRNNSNNGNSNSNSSGNSTNNDSDEENVSNNEKMIMDIQKIEQNYSQRLNNSIISSWHQLEQPNDDPTLDICFLVQGKPIYCHLCILQNRCGTKFNQIFNDDLKNNKKGKGSVYLEDHLKFTVQLTQQSTSSQRSHYNIILDGCHLLSFFILLEYIYNDTIDYFTTREIPIICKLPSIQHPDRQDVRYDLISLSKFLDLPFLYDSVSSTYTPAPQPSLLENFLHMIITNNSQTTGTDVKIILKDGSIFCHEVILRQRCPFFTCMFDPKVNWVGNRRSHQNQQHIPVNLDHHSLEIMKLLLIYIYSSKDDEHIVFDSITGDSVDQLMSILIQLLGAADEFLLPGLKTLCERTLIPMITLRTAGALLEYSHYYYSSSLKSACLKLIQVNMTSFVTSGLLTHIDNSLIQELESFICDEQRNSRPFAQSPILKNDLINNNNDNDDAILLDDEDIQMTVSTWIREETPVATNYMEYLETIMPPIKKDLTAQSQFDNSKYDIKTNDKHTSKKENENSAHLQQQKKNKDSGNKKKGSPRGTPLFLSYQEQQAQQSRSKSSPSQEYTDTITPSSWSFSPDDSVQLSSKLSLRDIFNEEQTDHPLSTSVPKVSNTTIKKISQKERKRLQHQELMSSSLSPVAAISTTSTSQKSAWGVTASNVTPKMKDVINSEMGLGNDYPQITATSVIGVSTSPSANIKRVNINDEELLKGKKIYTSKEELLEQHQNGWDRNFNTNTMTSKFLFDSKKSLGPSFNLIPLVQQTSSKAKGKDKINHNALAINHDDPLRRSSFQAIQQEQKLEDDWKKGRKKNLILIQREETAIEELREYYIKLSDRGCGEYIYIHPPK